ncbi:hypothetical protein CCL20_25330 [Pseudomonas syringae]|nr:hypothetical protein CCL20_25330 [Pseudomonas syringae]
MLCACFAYFDLQPGDDFFQILQLQGLGLLFLCGVQRTNALDDLAHHRCLGRIDKTLADVPLSQR